MLQSPQLRLSRLFFAYVESKLSLVAFYFNFYFSFQFSVLSFFTEVPCPIQSWVFVLSVVLLNCDAYGRGARVCVGAGGGDGTKVKQQMATPVCVCSKIVAELTSVGLRASTRPVHLKDYH